MRIDYNGKERRLNTVDHGRFRNRIAVLTYTGIYYYVQCHWLLDDSNVPNSYDACDGFAVQKIYAGNRIYQAVSKWRLGSPAI